MASVPDEQASIDAAIAAFRRAALESGPWVEALRAMAVAVGGNHGQMIGIGAAAAVPFNWISDIPEDALAEFVAMNGADPRLNPRVRAGLSAPELQVLAESDFATPDLLKATPIYTDLFARYDIPFIALSRLTTTHDVMVGLSVMRSRKQGHIEDRERRIFRAIAPHARAAVSTRLALEHRGAALVAGALEAVSAAAFVLDFSGRVGAMTPAAEALLTGPHARLRLAGRRLQGRTQQDDAALARFVAEALRGDPGPPMVALRNGGPPVVLEAAAAPPVEHGLGFAPRVIVIARSGVETPKQGAALKLAFGLTPAELAVATALQRGLSPDEIAAERGVSIETVRSQIRGLMTKTDTRRQSELVALLGRYA